MLRFRNPRTQRFRIAMSVATFAMLAGAPLILGLTRPAPTTQPSATEIPGVVGVYAHGLASLGWAGLVAGVFALIFCICLLAGQNRQVGLRYLGKSARGRRTLVEGARTLAIIFGGVGLIVGSLSGLYAAMMAARPDLYVELPIPFFTFSLAIPCLLGGGLLYAAGRLGR